MEWNHVDMENRYWTLPTSKNGNPNLIYLNDQALAVLQSIPQIEGARFVFSTDGKRPVSGFSKWKKAVDALAPKVADWRLHDLRRTMSTSMQRLAVNFHVKEACLNHTVKGISKHYDKYEYLPEKKAAWNRWGGLLSRVVAGDAAAVEAFVASFRPVEPGEELPANVVALRA